MKWFAKPRAPGLLVCIRGVAATEYIAILGGAMVIGYGAHHFATKAKEKVVQQGNAIAGIESTVPGSRNIPAPPTLVASANGPLAGAAAACGRIVASCGIVIAVACSGTPRDIAKCCSAALKKRDEIEVQVCSTRRAPAPSGAPPTPEQNNAFVEFLQNVGNGLGAATVVVVGGILWVLTGGQWVPNP